MTTARLSVAPLTGALGAVVSGIDLSQPLDDAQRDAVYTHLLEHQVLFFRDQHLSDDAHLALARCFGEPFTFPIARLLGSDDGNHLGYIKDHADSAPKADDWHTDITWIAEPPKMAFLAGMHMPASGGDTMWASTTAAYDALSEPMKQICNGLRATHQVSEGIVDAFRAVGEDFVATIHESFPPVTHPLVRTHPDTGRQALFVASTFMTGIDGFTKAESDAMKKFLMNHIANPNFHVRWKWTEGDLAIWDERCTNHRALADHYPQRREVRRCTINGDAPFFTPAA